MSVQDYSVTVEIITMDKKYIRVSDMERMFSMKHGTCYNLMARGHIKTVEISLPGSIRCSRLIDLQSVLDFFKSRELPTISSVTASSQHQTNLPNGITKNLQLFTVADLARFCGRDKTFLSQIEFCIRRLGLNPLRTVGGKRLFTRKHADLIKQDMEKRTRKLCVKEQSETPTTKTSTTSEE